MLHNYLAVGGSFVLKNLRKATGTAEVEVFALFVVMINTLNASRPPTPPPGAPPPPPPRKKEKKEKRRKEKKKERKTKTEKMSGSFVIKFNTPTAPPPPPQPPSPPFVPRSRLPQQKLLLHFAMNS